MPSTFSTTAPPAAVVSAACRPGPGPGRWPGRCRSGCRPSRHRPPAHQLARHVDDAVVVRRVHAEDGDCPAGAPRTASAEPDTTGATTRTPGIARICPATACHWSMDLSRCSGGCTVAASRAGSAPRSGRVTSTGGSSWMWACAVSTRRMKLACMPLSNADMKTITPTPMAMPPMMKSVCKRPSRRKRTATITSKGSQVLRMAAASAHRGSAGAHTLAVTHGLGPVTRRRRPAGRPAPRPRRRP